MPHNPLNNLLRKIRKMLRRAIRQNVILFESVPPYSDNTWAVYQYIRNNDMLKNYLTEGKMLTDNYRNLSKDDWNRYTDYVKLLLSIK